jgi:23S rRNA (adenine1618-N6)-methyltransferase
MHPRNRHKNGYEFEQLCKVLPELKKYVHPAKSGKLSIDFSKQEAVKLLNKALLLSEYGLKHWDIPQGHLCPPVPGRADYIHYLADFLDAHFPNTKRRRILDIGVGANCIYPLLGRAEYNWSFVGTELATSSLEAAKNLLKKNNIPKKEIELRLQQHKSRIIRGVVHRDEYFDAVICNPPFFGSAEEAAAANLRKQRGLKKKNVKETQRNFAGQDHELWYEGGELAFLERMILESRDFGKQVGCFSSLLSREKHLRPLSFQLKKLKAKSQVVEMGQGQKQSRILCWWYS